MNEVEKEALEVADEHCIICGEWFEIEDGVFIDDRFICLSCFFSQDNKVEK